MTTSDDKSICRVPVSVLLCQTSGTDSTRVSVLSVKLLLTHIVNMMCSHTKSEKKIRKWFSFDIHINNQFNHSYLQ